MFAIPRFYSQKLFLPNFILSDAFKHRKCSLIKLAGIFIHHFSTSETEVQKYLKKHEKSVSFSLCSRVDNNASATIQYLDSEQSGPLVLFIHGLMSEFQSFGDPFMSLSKKGVRVVAPNLPGYGKSWIKPAQSFNHSPDEIASVLKSFLECINISRVDMVLAHSVGMFSAVNLVAENPQSFRSMALICPAGLKREAWVYIKPYWLVKAGAYCLHNSLLRLMALPFLRWGHRRAKADVSDSVIESDIHTIGNIDFQKVSIGCECTSVSSIIGVFPAFLFGSYLSDVIMMWMMLCHTHNAMPDLVNLGATYAYVSD
ncbi:uncharacterized protein LOC106459582 isoform X2 [Limulus polyphemus]|uniref:Uncharacterized protein LOC106459582 isoform X2 n=1 Tax=Limulus polyphemus TaxID=6850 RepID=A0ABM1SDU8_LIMPO|nr:uncharacterized protein LOC106459582 isoform X2 [Limulus polyphemus]